ncbi:hypothetical protein SUGI_0354930 [Cryptomeria japonica]|nr:hypothetical protein SUGI_0354930 [Cryptomeria japonica]
MISNADNQLLFAPVIEAEVKDALFQMVSDKAPSPDRFPALFYQACWGFMKDDITKLVEESRRKRKMLKDLNNTNIVLFPKFQECSTFADFRSITLCNSIYKVVSKVMVKRLKVILPHVITQEQSGFLLGRNIMDGIIITHEVLHSIKKMGI